MGLPTLDEEGKPRPKRGEYDYLVKDIRGPEKVEVRKKNRVISAVLQLAFGLVGVGYVYLDEMRKALIAAVAFIGGSLVVLYAEMKVYPSAAETNTSLLPVHYLAMVFSGILALGYVWSVYDCYRLGEAAEKSYKAKRGYEPDKPRKPTPQERMEQAIREHENDGLGLE
jgi:hypothetical protein